MPNVLKQVVTDAIAAKYPECKLDTMSDTALDPPDDRPYATWSVELVLWPELSPILRHSQFEDVLNGKFADPIDSILKTIRPDSETW